MFDRFTEGARKAMGLSRNEAEGYGHDFIGTEHILLGLVKEGGAVEKTLRGLEIDEARVRGEIEKVLVRGTRDFHGMPPFTPLAKKALEKSMEYSHAFGHDFIGVQHIMLGLLSIADGVAHNVLAGLCPDGTRLGDAVLRSLAEDPLVLGKSAMSAEETLELMRERLDLPGRMDTWQTAFPMESSESLHAGAFVLVDGDGAPRARLELGPSGAPRFVLIDREARERAVIRLDENGDPEIELRGPDGTTTHRIPW